MVTVVMPFQPTLHFFFRAMLHGCHRLNAYRIFQDVPIVYKNLAIPSSCHTFV